MKLAALVLALLLVAAVVTSSARPPGARAQSPAWQNITPASPCAFDFGCLSIATDPTHLGTVYLGTEQGIWKSVNQGANWARADQPWGTDFCGSRGFDGRVWSLSVASNGDVYANNGYGCTQGALRSTDGGVHWTPLDAMNTANGPDINHVDVDPANPAHLIVSYHSGSAGVNESSDFGASWTFHPGSGSASWAFFVTSTTWINTTSTAGVWRTTNSGASWVQVSPYNAMHGNAQMYKASDGSLYLTADRAILRSADQGATWAVVLANSALDGFEGIIGDGTYVYTRTANTGVANTGPLPFRRALESDPTVWSDFGQALANGPMSMTSDGQYIYSSNWNAGVWRLPIGGAVSPTPSPLATASPLPTPIATSTATTVVPTSTPLVSPIPQPTSSPIPTPTVGVPTPTPSPSPCQLSVRVNGVDLWLDEAAAFCAGAHF